MNQERFEKPLRASEKSEKPLPNRFLSSWLRRGIVTLTLLLFAGVFTPLSVTAGTPAPVVYLPLISRGGLPLPPPDEASNRLNVPPGFAIRIFASGLPARPRLMEIGPDGSLYVALLDAGKIVRLPDRNQDGLADGVETVISGLSGPHNLEWFESFLYVAQNDKIQRFTDTNGDGLYERDVSFQIDLPGPLGHSTRTLHFGPDGKLYVSVGSSCNICDESGPYTSSGYDPRRAAILRYNPDGTIPSDNPFRNASDTRLRAVWAYGLRNSVDFTWSPSGQLWASSHGSDNLLDSNGQPDTLPPEELVIPVQEGQSHGWPYCYTPVSGLNNPPQPETRDLRMSLPVGFTCAMAIPALFTGPAHAAPIGLGWGPNSEWPAAFRDDLYLALHGSWNTNNPANYRDCKVERILIEGGAVTGSMSFVNGFRAAGQKCGDASSYGRPADVETSARGEMFISDDKSNRIYRVIYTGN